MILKQINDTETFDIRSIKLKELEHVVQGLELLLNNNNSILKLTEKEQQKIYIDAATNNVDDSIKRYEIKTAIINSWDKYSKTMKDNSVSIQNTLTQIRTIK